MRECSAETAAACCWSSQNPGCPSSVSSSASRALSRSGSKVTTDPVELGPDPFELLLQRELPFLSHRGGDGTASHNQPFFTASSTASRRFLAPSLRIAALR